MSLNKEILLLENKLTGIRRERTKKTIEADMFIHQIRDESSPYLNIDEIDIIRLKTAVDCLETAIFKIAEIDTEIKRLEKLM